MTKDNVAFPFLFFPELIMFRKVDSSRFFFSLIFNHSLLEQVEQRQ